MIRRLVSACLWWPSLAMQLEVIHQRRWRHRLEALTITAWDEEGHPVSGWAIDPQTQWVDLTERLSGFGSNRLLVVCDARYDTRLFPYRPHHYLHVDGDPPLYLALNAARAPRGQAPLHEASELPEGLTYRVIIANLGARERAPIVNGHPVRVPGHGHREVRLHGRSIIVQSPARLVAYLIGWRGSRLAYYDHLFPIKETP